MEDQQPTEAAEPRMEYRNGKLYEFAPQEVEGEDPFAAIEEARRNAQSNFDVANNAYNQAKTASEEADKVAEDRAKELEDAQAVKEDAVRTLLKSNARCAAAERAKANPMDDEQSEPENPTDDSANDEVEPDGSGTEAESVALPIHDADGNIIEPEGATA